MDTTHSCVRPRFRTFIIRRSMLFRNLTTAVRFSPPRLYLSRGREFSFFFPSFGNYFEIGSGQPSGERDSRSRTNFAKFLRRLARRRLQHSSMRTSRERIKSRRCFLTASAASLHHLFFLNAQEYAQTNDNGKSIVYIDICTAESLFMLSRKEVEKETNRMYAWCVSLNTLN